MSRPQPGFAAADPPEQWAATRGRFRPERLDAPLETLPGVGPTLKKRLARLGLERVGDLLDHRPRRYERPAPEKRIADLFGERVRWRTFERDVLETNLGVLAGGDFALVGNVPYYITTPIIFKALEPPIPRRSVFLVQREVAERMAAAADTESYGALTVNLAVVAKVEIVAGVPARVIGDVRKRK